MPFRKGMAATNAVSVEEQARALGMILRHQGDYRRAAAELGMSADKLRARVKRAKARGIKPRISVSANTVPPEDIEPIPVKYYAPKQPKKSVANSRVLVISDTHFPYSHPDTLEFLTALNRKYCFDRIIHIGDELDFHSMSYHESSPELDSAGRELQRGQEFLWELEKMFPKMDLLESNHGSMAFRKALTAGIPSHLIVDYRDAIFGVKLPGGGLHRPNDRGSGWNWHRTLVLDLPNGQRCLFVHSMSVSTKRNTEMAGMSYCQGHFHGQMEIVYVGTPDALNWGITVGCLIDNDSLAFAYNKNTMKRPIIGCAGVVDSHPRLFPMVLARGGRWDRTIP